MPTDDEHAVIVNASDHAAHLVLIALCNENVFIRAKAADMINSASRVLQPLAGSVAGQKRRADDKDQKLCKRCKTFYHAAAARGKGICAAHEGETEPDMDSDFWADHDEDCHGTIDSEEMRAEFPEGFIWNCCNQPNVNAPGCVKQDHHESVLEDDIGDGDFYGPGSSVGVSTEHEASPAPKKTKVESGVITIDD